MIKKILSKLFSQKITEKDIECAIDEQTVDCKHFDDDQDKAYVGVPAPIDHVGARHKGAMAIIIRPAGRFF